jgi:hypothetical protein
MSKITDGKLLLMEIERLPIPEHEKTQVLDLMRRWAGTRFYIPKFAMHRAQAVSFARVRLDAGDAISTVRDRLVTSGHCKSQDSAYRRIHDALNERGNDRAAEIEAALAGQIGQQPPII